MSDTDIGVEGQIRGNMPPEYKDHLRENMRRQLGDALMQRLIDGRRYTVRMIESEKLLPRLTQAGGYYPEDPITEIRYVIELSIVQMRRLVMIEPTDYSAMSWKRLSASALDEIKYRVGRWLRFVKRV